MTEFLDTVADVWHTGVLGINLGDVVSSLLVLLVFLGLRRAFFRVVLGMIRTATSKTQTELDDVLLATVEKPLGLAFVVVGVYAAGSFIPLNESSSAVFGTFIRSLIAATLFWTIFRAIEPLSSLMDRGLDVLSSVSMRDTMKGFFVRLIKFIVICLGIATVFQEWGFNVAAILGGLGLVGMAVAFGAQNFIANLFAGLTIFLDHVFEKGNWVRTPDVEGVVEDIGFRATRIRRFDKALVTIPNSMLAGGALVNFSRMTNRRIYWTIGVEYRTTQDQLRAIVRDIIQYLTTSPDFETDPSKQVSCFVFVDAFGPSSIDILLYCFTKTTQWKEWLACKERLAYKIKAIVEGHGAAFAFPSTSLYVESLPLGHPETFPLPEPVSSRPPSP
ncbi:MAG: mechanosensitive ion channel family protein [Nitrospira sp.]|nr:mechanosensitive ion channel family protein [Nitrospira sp.]